MNWTLTKTANPRERGEIRGQFRAYCPPAPANPPAASDSAKAKSPLECRGAFRAWQPAVATPAGK
jgi:hypothetical protein